MIILLSKAILGLCFYVPALAHMNMKTPAPLNHENNIFRDKSKPIDIYYNFPLYPDGSNYPCRGYINLVGTPEGRSPGIVWTAGEKYYITLEPQSQSSFVQGGTHYGGSCQISLSYDRGKTFKVIKSFMGSCPHRVPNATQDFYFTIPKEAPTGDAVLSWTWFNREQEMFQNCAVITVQKGGAGISHLPDMLKANINNGCFTPWNTAEVAFPDPGLEVEYGDGEYTLQLPEGICGKTVEYSLPPYDTETRKTEQYLEPSTTFEAYSDNKASLK